MKLFFTIIILSFYTQTALSQALRDSSGTGNQKKDQTEQKVIVDTNGNGIDDREENASKRFRHSKDKFIDKDGDGICDGRASGFGLRRGIGGKGKQVGKKSGQGGKP